MIKIRIFWNYLQSTLWFLPTLLVAFSSLVAFVLIGFETLGSRDGFLERSHLFGAGAQGARIMLSTIAGSMMTVVGITFSMTLVALALASNQYTSRILRSFMRNRLTQLVIGFFVSIFTYCLIILWTIRGIDEGQFIPSLAVFVAFILALGGVGVLIFFIHHIASSIQASSILSSVANETFDAIDRIYPEQIKNDRRENDEALELESIENIDLLSVLAKKRGYIQSINVPKLIKLAKEKRIVVRIERKVGEFVVKNTPIVFLEIDKEPDQEIINTINSAFHFNEYRTSEQDVSFGLRQLVDIALKALSPGINDTTTAVMCLNYLTTIMAELATRKFKFLGHYEENKLRVIAKERNFETLLDEAFDQIRESGKENTEIILTLLESLQIIATQTVMPSRLHAIEKQTRWISEVVKHNIKSSHEHDKIEKRIVSLHIALKKQFNLFLNC